MCLSGCGSSGTVKDSQKQWFAVGCVRPSSEESATRSGLKISNIVEEGLVEYVLVSAPPVRCPGPSSLRASSGKSRERKVNRSPFKLPRRLENASRPESPSKKAVVKDSTFSAHLAASNPTEKRGVLDENVKPLLFSKAYCHNCNSFLLNL